MTIKDSLKKFFIEEPKVGTVSESKEIDIKLPNISLPKISVENKNLFYWLGLIPVFFITLYVRTRNLPLLQGKYLIELDSYFFFRYAKMLLEQGSLPAIDFMRYSPLGYSTVQFKFFPLTLVYLYKIAHSFFPNLSQIEWHVIYPPVITVISLVFFFLFVKELLGHRTAFIATAFLAVIPAYLQRTMAGFADHEAVAMLWMFISLWLFVLAWKSENWKKLIPLSAMSGLFAGAMAATWGGYTFLTLSVTLFLACYALLTNHSVKPTKLALPWSLAYLIGGMIFIGKGLDFIKTLPNALLLFVLFFLVLYLVLNKKLKSTKMPSSLVAAGISAVTGLVANFFLKIVDFSSLISNLTKQDMARHFYTVSENAQPYFFNDWWGGFGFIFFLAFIGASLYFYRLFENEGKSKSKFGWLALAAYVIFFLAFIFGRLSPSSSSLVSFFSNTYLYWLIGFVLSIFSIYLLARYKEKTLNLEDKWVWILLSTLLLTALLAARGQVRLIFATVPPMAIAAGYFVSAFIDTAKKQERALKIIAVAALIFVSLFVFVADAKTTLTQNQYSGSMTPGQWGNAMAWIRESTPEDSVFAHWWDYGYLTIAVGERASVTDGGNSMGWNYQSGRYFLTGKDETSTLTYLKTHNVTHILISEEEIPKYHAFSYIGSDENLDMESTIGTFVLQSTKEVRNGTLLIYGGGWGLDKDYLIDDLILPEGQAGIFGFNVPSDLSSQVPQAFVSYKNQQFTFDVPCLWMQGKRYDFDTNENSTLKGCLVLIPYVQDQDNSDPVGGALWASEKVWDTNFARLYMYGEDDPNFKLVYQDEIPLVYYQGRLIGPIKIWSVEYPTTIKSDSYYLEWSKYG